MHMKISPYSMGVFRFLSIGMPVLFSAILSPEGGHGTEIEITFQRLSTPAGYTLNFDSAIYDMAPSAMFLDGRILCWLSSHAELEKGGCDVISLANMDPANPEGNRYHYRIYRGSEGFAAWDNRHINAPSVIRVAIPGLISAIRKLTGNEDLEKVFLMYHEIEPQHSGPDGNWLMGLAYIGVSISADGMTWYRHSDPGGYGNPKWILESDDERFTTPLIVSEKAMQACGYEYNPEWPTGHRLQTPKGPGCYYGAGHPGAVQLPDGRVRLFYYDGGERYLGTGTSYHYRDSYDGLSFLPPASFRIPEVSGPGPGIHVQYDPVLRIWIAFTVIHSQNSFSWALSDEDHNVPAVWSPWITIGQSKEGNLGGASQPILVSHPDGTVDLSRPVILFSGEFRLEPPVETIEQWYLNSWIERMDGKFTFSGLPEAGLKGRVTDSEGHPIASAQITALGGRGTHQETTDTEGHYDFGNLSPGTWDLTVTAEGYISREFPETPLSPGKLVTFPISLK